MIHVQISLCLSPTSWFSPYPCKLVAKNAAHEGSHRRGGISSPPALPFSHLIWPSPPFIFSSKTIAQCKQNFKKECLTSSVDFYIILWLFRKLTSLFWGRNSRWFASSDVLTEAWMLSNSEVQFWCFEPPPILFSETKLLVWGFLIATVCRGKEKMVRDGHKI